MILGLVAGSAALLSFSSANEEEKLRARIPPCFEVGVPFHHRFFANCKGRLDTPSGAVDFFTNQDRIRDRSRTEILSHKNRLMVLGDSFVEGWWSDLEHSLSSALRARIPGTYFINAGLRSTGPIFQAAYLEDLVRVYKPSTILWLLNDTDPVDDRFACAVAVNMKEKPNRRIFGAPEFELNAWQKNFLRLFGDSHLSERLRLIFYRLTWNAVLRENRKCDPCQGTNEISSIARKEGVSLRPIFLQLDSSKFTGHYKEHSSDSKGLLQCLANEGLKTLIVDFQKISSSERDSWFWKNDFHLSREGTFKLAEIIARETEYTSR